MSVITPQPIVLKNVSAIIGGASGDDYAAFFTSVALTPTSNTVSITGMKPDAIYQDSSPATWVADITYMQDWSETGLSRYLFENEGESVTIALSPVSGGPTFTVTATIVTGAVGGSVGEFATATVSLPLSGKPVLS